MKPGIKLLLTNAEDKGIQLSYEEAEYIYKNFNKYFDDKLGLNWNAIFIDLKNNKGDE